MSITISTVTFTGIETVEVAVQVHISSGMPSFTVVGLPDKTIAESKERVKAAISSIGITLPAKKITINLAPADVSKEGSHFDLPIAVGLLTALGIIDSLEIEKYIILGELSLNGDITSVAGILPAAVDAVARDKGIICPAGNGKEAAWSGNKDIIAATNLLTLINHFKGTNIIAMPEVKLEMEKSDYPDFAEIAGQDQAKRAMEIAAAGGHNLLMSGPPGSGKSMLASCLPGILNKMSASEILECSSIASVAGLIHDGKLTDKRPYRAPHHSCSMAAMVGGGVGKRVKPGEISLAHNGVLFLDELPEFQNSVLESLRQPMETRDVLISRANSHVKFPANFQLIAAMNPCKCGYLTDADQACSKAPKCGADYQAKISGPILDRFDILIEVAALKVSEVISHQKSKVENSAQIAARVARARDIQSERYNGYGIHTNAQLHGQLLTDFATPVNDALDLLNKAVEKFKLTMRGYNRILKLARTIADLDNSKTVNKYHIAEALSFRIADYI